LEGSFAVADSVSISKHSAEALVTRDKDYIVFDGVLTGFGVRVMPSGKRFFLIQYRKRGKTRRLGLGQFGPVTAEIARREATRLLADVRAGDGDPVAARDADRQALTMEELERGSCASMLTLASNPPPLLSIAGRSSCSSIHSMERSARTS
jgi:hypothetical protein